MEIKNSGNALYAAPVAQSERIIILDSLRGIAILGILLMNIPGFSIPGVAESDPTLINFSRPNYYTWYVVEGILEGTQRAIFSMLFGAGMLLFISRLEKRLDGMMPAEYYFRRQLWLLLFGLFNAYVLLWWGDILFHYALCGMLLFAFRRLSAKKLLIASCVCLLLFTVRENMNLYRSKDVIEKGEAISRMDTSQVKLTPFQQDDLKEMLGKKDDFSRQAKQKQMEKAIRYVQGPFAKVYKQNSERGFGLETRGFFYFVFFDVLMFMFMGMAFYKNGVLLGQQSSKVYWWLFIIGLGVGLFISYLRLDPVLKYNFDDYKIAKNIPFEFYGISRLFRSLGIFGGIMLLYKSGLFKWFFALMRPVGQMAFTNYLMQSLICGLIFYGIGFGLYGKLQRYEIYYVVLAVWIVEIIWSHIWLRYFRFGPMEWLWRSLTYWKWQPIKKR